MRAVLLAYGALWAILLMLLTSALAPDLLVRLRTRRPWRGWSR